MDNEPRDEVNEVSDGGIEEIEPIQTMAVNGNPDAPPPPSGGSGFRQNHRFMWGGIIVLVGTLLPFGSDLITSMHEDPKAAAEVVGMRQKTGKEILDDMKSGKVDEKPAVAAEKEDVRLPATRGCETFSGALFLLFALLLIGQMRNAIAERKVALGGVLLMFIPAGWAWFKVVMLGGHIEGFSFAEMYKFSELEQLTLHMGAGFVLVLIGSTWVVLGFFSALVGAATGGGSKSTGARTAAARGGRSRRR